MNGPAPAVRAVCLAGPTASGKTAAALALAAQLPIEIISMDSALVYRGMDIGTAKPSAAERAAVPHHLIDIVDPAQPYSAARFAADAHQLIADIHSRGRLPLLVGGTMLYFKALRDGLDVMPPADPAVRAQLDAEAAVRGWPALHADLAQVDPATAARLPPGDAQRVQRALEVWRVSGRALSSWQQGAGSTSGDSTLPLVALAPTSRAWLHARIAERFDGMLAAGLVTEVSALRARGDLRAETPSMRCVGYRQVWEALDGVDNVQNMAGLRDKGIAATRQLAKRQLTWLRSLQPQVTVACDARDALAQVTAALVGAWTSAPRTGAGH